jgi:TonB family protein
MPKNVRFWSNVALIGIAHVVAIVILVRWSRESDKPNDQSIVWMNGGAGDGAATPTMSAPPRPKPMKISTPPPVPPRKEEPEEEQPPLAPAKSEIQLATPTPRSTATASPARTPKPAIKATPKPTPKATPKPTPKPTPKKIILAKATPKPSPKIKPTPSPTEPAETVIPKASVAPQPFNSPEPVPVPKAEVANAGAGKGTSPGAGGHAGGSGGESRFGWYGSMLHDRFHSEWTPPATIASGNKLAVGVKLRIEKDGRVSSFEIVKPSGNAAFDETVAAVAKRVTQVEPPPPELLKGDHYNVRINFEPDSD